MAFGQLTTLKRFFAVLFGKGILMKVAHVSRFEVLFFSTTLLAINALAIGWHGTAGNQQLARLDDVQRSKLVGGFLIACAKCDTNNAKECPKCIPPNKGSCQYIKVDEHVTVSRCEKDPFKARKGLVGQPGCSNPGTKTHCKLGPNGCFTEGGGATCGKMMYNECVKNAADPQHGNQEWCSEECQQSVNDCKNCSDLL
jgi:hypothetical protein